MHKAPEGVFDVLFACHLLILTNPVLVTVDFKFLTARQMEFFVVLVGKELLHTHDLRK